jgi:hypothetical protein
MGNASPFSYQFNISRACIAARTFQSSFATNHIVELTIFIGQHQCWWRFLRFILGSDIMEGCWEFPCASGSLSSLCFAAKPVRYPLSAMNFATNLKRFDLQFL